MSDRARLAVEIRDDSTGLADEQQSGADVPRRKHHLPEGLEAPAGDVSQIESGRSGAAKAGAVEHDRREYLQISIATDVLRLEREAGADQGANWIFDARD